MTEAVLTTFEWPMTPWPLGQRKARRRQYMATTQFSPVAGNKNKLREFWENRYYFKEAGSDDPEDIDGWVRVSRANTYVYGSKVKAGSLKRAISWKEHAQMCATTWQNKVGIVCLLIWPHTETKLPLASRLEALGQPYNLFGRISGTNCVGFSATLLKMLTV